MNKVTVSLVTWNGEKFLEKCLTSLFNQSFREFTVLAIDNGSTDHSRGILSRYPVQILANNHNLGFAAGHNQGIGLAQTPYILILNQDIILEPNFLAELVSVLDSQPRVASVGGKLLRAQAPHIIDTTGLLKFNSGQVIDRGADEKDTNQYNKSEQVFGISGAAVLYRKSALEDCKTNNEYFDQDFFSYKEDVDLAWRLKNAGWQAIYQPQAIGYHYRGSGPTSRSITEKIKFWFQRSNIVTYNSYKNHIFTLIKNLPAEEFAQHAPRIMFYELIKLAAQILKPQNWKVFVEIGAKLPIMLKKRKLIQDKRNLTKLKWTSQ